MTASLTPDPHLIATHTTAATASVARWVTQHHGMAVQQCHLIRRGLNDNYALRAVDGQRYVARLYAIRPRGEFNVPFEVSLLAHLHAAGVGVAAPVLTAAGGTHVPLQFPEGPRALALFVHADGTVPDALEDFELTGHGLAQIHSAAHGYHLGGGQVSDADMAALPLFIQLRHLWNMGEGVGRLHHWGTSTMPADWLAKQVDVLAAWQALDLRAWQPEAAAPGTH